MQCDNCQALTINGIPTHETGCLSSHMDLATGEPYREECKWCGTWFTPALISDGCDHWELSFCQQSCAEAYHN